MREGGGGSGGQLYGEQLERYLRSVFIAIFKFFCFIKKVQLRKLLMAIYLQLYVQAVETLQVTLLPSTGRGPLWAPGWCILRVGRLN